MFVLTDKTPLRLQAEVGPGVWEDVEQDWFARPMPKTDATPPQVLAIDVSKASTGWASMQFAPRDARYGLIDWTKPGPSSWDVVFARFHAWLMAELGTSYRPHVIAFEQLIGQHKSHTTAHRHGGWEAIILAVCARERVGWMAVPPSTVKKHITGFGNAPKDAVAEVMRSRYSGLGPDTPDDVTDALAIATTAQHLLMHEGPRDSMRKERP